MKYKKECVIAALITLLAGCLCLNNTFCDYLITSLGHLLNRQLSLTFWKYGIQKTGIEFVTAALLLLLYVFVWEKKREMFFALAIGSVISLFSIYIFENTLNFPIAEDYNIFLKFLNSYFASKNISAVLNQYEDVIMTTQHAWTVLLYRSGFFSFTALMLFADSCIILTYFVLLKTVPREHPERNLIFLTIAILFFQFQYYDVTTWASGGIGHGCTVFYALLTLYSVNRNTPLSFFISLLLCWITVLNFPSGFPVLAAGLLLLLSQQRKKESLIWIASCLLIAGFCFHNYSAHELNASSGFALPELASRVANGFLFSCVFLGSFFQFLYAITLPALFGLVIWIFFLVLTVKKYYLKNPLLYGILAFILMVSCLPPIGRAGCSIESGLTVRYGIYSIVAVAACIIAWLEIIDKKYLNRAGRAAFIFSLSYHFTSNLFFYPEVPIRKELLSSVMTNMKEGKDYILPPHTPENGKVILEESMHNHIYTQPE